MGGGLFFYVFSLRKALFSVILYNCLFFFNKSLTYYFFVIELSPLGEFLTQNIIGGSCTMDIKELVMSWLALFIDFLRMVGLEDVADEISNKIVMPL